MDATTAQLKQIKDAFDNGLNFDYSTWAEKDIRNAAQRTIDRANSENIEPLSLDKAQELAKVYGRWVPAAQLLGQHESILECLSGLAHIYSHVTVAHRDQARAEASKLFKEVYVKYQRCNNRDQAAIALTNSAVSILEMHNPNSYLLNQALDACEKSISMRQRGSIDLAYSLLNLALAMRKNIWKIPTVERGQQYTRILNSFDSSLKIFQRHGEDSALVYDTYFHNILDTLSQQIDWQTAHVNEQFASTLSNDQYPKELIELLSPVELFNLTRSNPAILGLSETPDWVPSYYELTRKAANMIPGFYDRIEECEAYLRRPQANSTILPILLFQIRTKLLEPHNQLDIPWVELEILWEQEDFERHFIYARSILMWEGAVFELGNEKFHVLLKRISEMLIFARSNWQTEEIEKLLTRNDHTFRFTACYLAQLEDWENAFKTLEFSRGLRSSRSIRFPKDEYLREVSATSWVHVTHSPHGAYCIEYNGLSYSGRSFSEITGSKLAALFTGLLLERPGPLSPQISNRHQSLSSADIISKFLAPIGDWIARLDHRDIAIMPGGFFQAFPLWACGELDSVFEDGTRRLFTVPSRSIALRHCSRQSNEPLWKRPNIRLLEAHSVTGSVVLPRSKDEIKIISALYKSGTRSTTLSASRSNTMDALKSSDFVQFSGHSQAAVDPNDSSLVTYAESVVVADILNVSIPPKLIVFSSCESSLARNFMLQDEMLTLQSASFYAGSTMTIGTIWKVYDLPSLVFSVKFHEFLAPLDTVTISQIYEAFRLSILWLKRATYEDMSDFVKQFDLPVAIPAGPSTFFSFYDWSAYSLMGVPQ